jgi:hypothetical protein
MLNERLPAKWWASSVGTKKSLMMKNSVNATRRSAEAILNLGETSFTLARSGRWVSLRMHRCDACQCHDAPETGQYPAPTHSPRLFPTRNDAILRAPNANLTGYLAAM